MYKNISILNIVFGLLLFFIFSGPNVYSQSFGFGCLGLSGVYGGYSYQTYKADGLNDGISSLFNSTGYNVSSIDFKYAEGFRFGANIFRAKFSRLFITLKGYYQFLKESRSIRDDSGNSLLLSDMSLEMNHWGIGVDLGVPIFSFIDLKVVEGGVNFYEVDFTIDASADAITLLEDKYSFDKVQVSYYLASGLIVHIIKDYISLEGTLSYDFLEVDNLLNASNIGLRQAGSSNPLIERGGLAAAIQLNVGFTF